MILYSISRRLFRPILRLCDDAETDSPVNKCGAWRLEPNTAQIVYRAVCQFSRVRPHLCFPWEAESSLTAQTLRALYQQLKFAGTHSSLWLSTVLHRWLQCYTSRNSMHR